MPLDSVAPLTATLGVAYASEAWGAELAEPTLVEVPARQGPGSRPAVLHARLYAADEPDGRRRRTRTP